MSAATELFAPGYVGDDERYDDHYGDHCGDRGPGVPPVRHLTAVPAGVPVRVPGSRVREDDRPAVRAPRTGSASVSVLLPPEHERPPVRLTRRGVVVLALAVAALGALLVWLAALSAPSADGAAPGGAAAVPTVVTVGAGDTLWSIAGRVAPNDDPRATVEHLRDLNHLDSVALEPGQQLRVR